MQPRLRSRLVTYRMRRLLVSRWRRATRWEFWPAWLVYVPVIGYIAALMVKFRSVTAFTAANPAILAGGFIGESKYAILTALSAAGAPVAPGTLIGPEHDADEKLRRARAFMRAHRITFPVVVKPDQGQRGSGVVIARTEGALAVCLARAATPVIVQDYVPGVEFGVFYCRHPEDPCGDIFSITAKEPPTVVGDGRRTLEALILGDERGVCMAGVHLARHAAALQDVPPAGARIPLVELGSHCRGALFLNGADLLTPALHTAVDRIGRRFDGFYFGRFDVRADSADDLRQGRFRIIELNGVTSEATHIYHPGTPLMSAWRVLCRQWRLAFSIGAANIARGHAPASVITLIRLLWDYRRVARLHLRPGDLPRADEPHPSARARTTESSC